MCALHETAELPGPLRRALDDLRPQPHGKVALQQWASAVEEHPAITRPAVALRDRVRKRVSALASALPGLRVDVVLTALAGPTDPGGEGVVASSAAAAEAARVETGRGCNSLRGETSEG